MTKKRSARILVLVLMLLVLSLTMLVTPVLAGTAANDDIIDPDRKGSITIHKYSAQRNLSNRVTV